MLGVVEIVVVMGILLHPLLLLRNVMMLMLVAPIVFLVVLVSNEVRAMMSLILTMIRILHIGAMHDLRLCLCVGGTVPLLPCAIALVLVVYRRLDMRLLVLDLVVRGMGRVLLMMMLVHLAFPHLSPPSRVLLLLLRLVVM